MVPVCGLVEDIVQMAHSTNGTNQLFERAVDNVVVRIEALQAKLQLSNSSKLEWWILNTVGSVVVGSVTQQARIVVML